MVGLRVLVFAHRPRIGERRRTIQGVKSPGETQVRVAVRELVEGEGGDAEAGFGAVEVGDDGVGEEFGVAGAEFDGFEDELHDTGRPRATSSRSSGRRHGSRG